MLHACLAAVSPFPPPTPPIPIAVDVEGIELGRKGRVSIIQLFTRDSDTVWLIDITTLKNVAFDSEDGDGRSLRGILENPMIRKYFYEVRNDSDALYNLHQVSLAGIYDLQLLELAARLSNSPFQKKRSDGFVNGLKRSIQGYLPHPSREWAQAKEAGRKLFAPELGGRYEVFEDRPLDPRLMAYCAQDVALLFQLEDVLKRQLGDQKALMWEDKIVAESGERVKLAYSPSWNGQGRHMAVAPAGWCK